MAAHRMDAKFVPPLFEAAIAAALSPKIFVKADYIEAATGATNWELTASLFSEFA